MNSHDTNWVMNDKELTDKRIKQRYMNQSFPKNHKISREILSSRLNYLPFQCLATKEKGNN